MWTLNPCLTPHSSRALLFVQRFVRITAPSSDGKGLENLSREVLRTRAAVFLTFGLTPITTPGFGEMNACWPKLVEDKLPVGKESAA